MNFNQLLSQAMNDSKIYQATGALPPTCQLMTAAQFAAANGDYTVARAQEVAAVAAKDATDPSSFVMTAAVRNAFANLGINNAPLVNADLNAVGDAIDQTFVTPLMTLAARAMLAVSTTGVDLTQPVPTNAVISSVSKVYGLAMDIATVVQTQMTKLAYRLCCLGKIVMSASANSQTPANVAIYNAIMPGLTTLGTSVFNAIYGENFTNNGNLVTYGQGVNGAIVNLVQTIENEVANFAAYSANVAYSDAANSIRQTGQNIDSAMNQMFVALQGIQTAFTTFSNLPGANDFFALLAETGNNAPLAAFGQGDLVDANLANNLAGYAPFFGLDNFVPATLNSLAAPVSGKNVLLNDFQFTGCDAQAATTNTAYDASVMTYLNLFLSTTSDQANQFAALVDPTKVTTAVTPPLVASTATFTPLPTILPAQLSIQTVSNATLYGVVPANNANGPCTAQTFISDANGSLKLGAPLWGTNAIQLPTQRANNARNIFEEIVNEVSGANNQAKIIASLQGLTAAQQIAKVEMLAKAFFGSVADQSAANVELDVLWVSLMDAFGLDKNVDAVNGTIPVLVSNFIQNMLTQSNLAAEETIAAAANMKCGLGGTSDRADQATKLISAGYAQANIWTANNLPVLPDTGTTYLAGRLASLQDLT